MNEQFEIPALPVVVPLAVVVFVILLWRLHRHGALTPLRILVSAAVCVYGAGVIGNTLLPINIGAPAPDLPWWVFLNLTPFDNTVLSDMLRNVLVFIPLSFLLPLVTRFHSALAVVLVGFSISLAMELVQLLNAVTGRGGHIADINDLLANTLGVAIGYALFRLLMLVPSLARLARAATWPDAASRSSWLASDGGNAKGPAERRAVRGK